MNQAEINKREIDQLIEAMSNIVENLQAIDLEQHTMINAIVKDMVLLNKRIQDLEKHNKNYDVFPPIGPGFGPGAC